MKSIKKLFLKIPINTYYLILIIFIVLTISNCNRRELDEYGGYYDERYQIYRYQSIKKESQLEATDGIRKPEPYINQIINAEIFDITGNMIWLKIKNRSVYTLISQVISNNFKNEKDALVAMFLEGISIRSVSANNSGRSNKFYKFANDNIKKIVLNKDLNIKFQLYGSSNAFSAIVFLPNADTKNDSQSLNYWIIKNGLSAYILPNNRSKINTNFIKAEDIARQDKAGIWSLNL